MLKRLDPASKLVWRSISSMPAEPLEFTFVACDAELRLAEGASSRKLVGTSLQSTERRKTASARSFSMEPLQFVIGLDWQVVSFSKEAKAQLPGLLDGAISSAKPSANLRELLIQTEPAWAKMLPSDISHMVEENRTFLPWDIERESLGMGWSIYLLEFGKDFYSVTLVPVMCTGGEATLAEDSLSFDQDNLQEILRGLFLRVQQQSSRFQYFVRHLPGSHFNQDSHCRFMLIKLPLEELLGSAAVRELQAGAEWIDWVHPSDRAEVKANVDRCSEANLPTSCRFRLLIPNGDQVLYLMELRIPVRGIDGSLVGFEGLWLDLTHEQIGQQRLLHSAWKDSLAQISGSLSHDFNNILAGLVSLSEMLLMDLDETDDLYKVASLIKGTTDQARELSGRIISLNNESIGKPDYQDFSVLVAEQIDLIKILLPQDAILDLQIPDEEFPIRVDSVSMRRILVNFAVNARDVIGIRGRVTLKMRKVDLATYDASHLVSSECDRVGEGVEFVFQDDGFGMPPEIVGSIFGAYFSTKNGTNSSGSGLGLYCLSQFARENHFDYGVRTQVGKGTEMILLFPLVGEEQDTYAAPEDETDLSEHFKEPPVAIFGSPNAATNAVLAGLCRRGIEVDELTEVSDLESWLAACSNKPKTVLIAFAYNEQSKVRGVCESIDLKSNNLQAILSLQGLDPVHFSDLLEGTFDQLLLSNAQPSECVETILEHLSATSR